MTIRHQSLTTAVALIAVAVGWTLLQPRPQRPRLSPPPPALIARPAKPALPPTARDLLERGALLELTASQRARLAALDAGWTRESAAAQADLEAAVDEFSRFMDEARAAGRVSVGDLQRRSAKVAELGADLRERRRQHAEAAAGILTDWQRARLGDAGLTVASEEGR